MGNPFAALKRLLRPAGTLAVATGAVAVVNRRLSSASELPLNHLDGVQRRWNWRGHEIFTTEQGQGEPAVLLVHGVYAGASSFEFRRLAPLLAADHRVVAFDLLGCGLSDRPNLPYTAELFVEQIVDALDELAPDRPAVVVASSLGAALAIRAIARKPDRVERLVAICPTGLGGVLDRQPTARERAVAALFRSPLVGEAAFNGLASVASLRRFLAREVYADPRALTPEVIDHCHAVTHQPGARFVPAAFIGGALNCDVARDLPFVAVPILFVWGEQARSLNGSSHAREHLQLAQNARLVTLPHSALLPHEEEPEATASAIDAFLAARPV